MLIQVVHFSGLNRIAIENDGRQSGASSLGLGKRRVLLTGNIFINSLHGLICEKVLMNKLL